MSNGIFGLNVEFGVPFEIDPKNHVLFDSTKTAAALFEDLTVEEILLMTR